MIVTTPYDANEALAAKARSFAEKMGVPFVARRRFSLTKLYEMNQTADISVYSEEGLFIYRRGEEKPFHFHPDTAHLRIKQLKNGEPDTMIRACALREGDRFLDCTLGLGSDSIVASYVTGEKGAVVGLESEKWLAAVVSLGLKRFESKSGVINDAMRRIRVEHADHLSYLQRLDERSFDVVYFDPMFRDPIKKSSNISSLRRYVNPDPLRLQAVEEATRVAAKRVVMKERVRSGEFERLGFQKVYRANASTSFGVIEIDG